MFLDVGNELRLIVPYGTATVLQQACVVAATPLISTLVVPHLGREDSDVTCQGTALL